MLAYSDFYDLARYCNENWEGGFTEKEVALNAYTYLVEYNESVKNHTCTDIINYLLKKLKEDNTDDSNYWYDEILCNIEYKSILLVNEYEVEIVETYRRRVKVKAADEDEAYEIVDERVNEGEIDIPRDGGDYKYDRELYVSEVKGNE